MNNRLLNFIKKYHRLKRERGYTEQYELFPSFEVIERNLNLTYDNIIDQLKSFKKLGDTEKKLAEYYLNTKEEKEPIKTKSKINLDKIKIMLLKFGMGIIGIIASILSVYFTFLWFHTIMNFILSFLLSICMVGFSIISFESILLFKQNKQFLLIFIFSLLWIIVVTFSMSSTLAGQLQLEFKQIKKESESNLIDNNNILLYQDYEKQISDYNIDIKGKRIEVDKLRSFLDTLNYDVTSDRKRYNTINWRINEKDKDIKNLKNKIELIQKKKEKLLKNDVKISVKKQVTFFEWLQLLFGVKSNVFKFILYLFPALFIDIISPLSLAVMLFYKQKE